MRTTVNLGGFKPQVINFIRKPPRAVVASDEEVLGLIGGRRLAGRGIGYVDAHLIASAFLTQGTTLLTLDRKMRAVAAELHIAAGP